MMTSSRSESLSLSVIVPCFNEEESLPEFFSKLAAWQKNSTIGRDAKIILVDDGSSDETWRVISSHAAANTGINGIRLLVNRGSHIALRCGYRHAKGSIAVNVPVDLQEPLENVDLLLEKMNERKADITLAVRHSREDTFADRAFSVAYHRMLKSLGLANLPIGGASQFMFSRRVLYLLNSYPDHSVTIDGFIAKSKFPTAEVYYHRRSADRATRWSFMRKISHAVDSIVAFSELPIRIMGVVGLVFSVLGFMFAILTIFRAFYDGRAPEGWTSIICAVVLIGGLNLIALSVIGEYLWRTLNETRRRPLYSVMEICGTGISATEDVQ